MGIRGNRFAEFAHVHDQSVPEQLPEGDGWGFCRLCNEHTRVKEYFKFNICFNCLNDKDSVIDSLVEIIVSERANYKNELSAISDACQKAKKGVL